MNPQAERRRFKRVNYSCKVEVRKENSESIFITDTENLSCGGVCITLPEEIKIDTAVELEINLLDDKPPLKCKGKVVWGIYHPPTPVYSHGIFANGIEFIEFSEENSLRINKIIKAYSSI